MKTSLLALSLVVAVAAPAAADDLAVEMHLLKLVQTTDEAGETVTLRQEAESLLPGDRLLYRIELANAGAEPATAVVLDLPVPAELIVEPESFAGDVAFEVTFATQDAPDALMAFDALRVPTEDGDTRPALPEDLGAVRVEIAEIAPEAQAFVEYEATLR